MEHTGSDATRLDRVETEVYALRDEVGGLKASVQSFGAVLTRIEDGIIRAQERTDHQQDRNRPNITAIVSVLITIIFAMIGGSWMTAGQIARLDERANNTRREMDQMHLQQDRLEDRVWRGKFGAADANK